MDQPIRVVHVLGSLYRGGAETMIMNLYRKVDRSKVQFDFIIHDKEYCDYKEEVLNLGGKIYYAPRYRGYNHLEYKAWWNEFFSEHHEYKIIHGHVRSTASIYLKIANKYGLKTICHSHSTSSRGNCIEKLVKDTMQFPIKNIANYLFACSNNAGEWLYGKKSIEKKNYRVIKNAIDIEKYKFDEVKRRNIRNELQINQDKFVIGHVGSFTEPKNHKFLLDLFFEIQKINENALLLLIGGGVLEEKIKNYAKELMIEDKVIFKGQVYNVHDYMQAMDVFLFPSLWEGLPVTVVEAQASGLYCIISDTITNEVCITPNIKSLSLKNDSLEKWTEVVNSKSIGKRYDNDSYIKDSGYDIHESVKELSNFYQKLVKKQ